MDPRVIKLQKEAGRQFSTGEIRELEFQFSLNDTEEKREQLYIRYKAQFEYEQSKTP